MAIVVGTWGGAESSRQGRLIIQGTIYSGLHDSSSPVCRAYLGKAVSNFGNAGGIACMINNHFGIAVIEQIDQLLGTIAVIDVDWAD